MSEWKNRTPWFAYRRPTQPRQGNPRSKPRHKLRLDPPHGRNLLKPSEDRDMPKDGEGEGEGEGVSIAAFWTKALTWLDCAAVPVVWAIVVGLIGVTSWLVFAPFSAAPEVPRPETGFPVQLLDPAWPSLTRDGRRASYVSDAPDDGAPEPALDLDPEGRPR